ncbi:MAG: hypothetical protein WBG57_03040, partial [Ornithinimicrobium sp.]
MRKLSREYSQTAAASLPRIGRDMLGPLICRTGDYRRHGCHRHPRIVVAGARYIEQRADRPLMIPAET